MKIEICGNTLLEESEFGIIGNGLSFRSNRTKGLEVLVFSSPNKRSIIFPIDPDVKISWLSNDDYDEHFFDDITEEEYDLIDKSIKENGEFENIFNIIQKEYDELIADDLEFDGESSLITAGKDHFVDHLDKVIKSSREIQKEILIYKEEKLTK